MVGCYAKYWGRQNKEKVESPIRFPFLAELFCHPKALTELLLVSRLVITNRCLFPSRNLSFMLTVRFIRRYDGLPGRIEGDSTAERNAGAAR